MINKKIGVLLLFVLLVSFGAKAQRATSMRINEVLVINEDNYVDDYGKRHAWIELFNSSAGTVNIQGCFLTNDKNNPKKYPIPKGDVLTLIPPHQHTLFWADGEPNRGTFHVNFTLDPSTENYIALYDADGKTLIDEVVIPALQKADVSYGRTIDGHGEWATLQKVTPSTNNVTLDSNEKIDNFKANDSLGIGMTLTAMAVVFTGLFLLFIIFKQIGKFSIAASKRNAQKASGSTSAVAANVGQESGEIFAAIGAALYEMSDDNHDIEHTVLTIRKVQRAYSPWSSKIYGLREVPKK
ncbi:OadG family transporter subunit [Parabacteroides bouchesdurhonensis]|uniref:OadG family transporter subunit n=1 Tax=Parabacteroides bouchesdurhonensis TaxID=1936995 RepID=UPI000E50EA86|nr:OadG family transporter subunit [Parabacteroides bouchesdurhonensis]RHJ92610.1 lamin tail domain-containing protein [Bacteroides sp. AM07-16]